MAFDWLAGKLGLSGRSEPPSLRVDPEISRLVGGLIRESSAHPGYIVPKLAELPSGARLLKLPRRQQVQAVLEAARLMLATSKRRDSNYKRVSSLRDLLVALLRRKLPFQSSDLVQLARTIGQDSRAYLWCWPMGSVLRGIENFVEVEGMSPELRKALSRMAVRFSTEDAWAENRKTGKRIAVLLQSPRQEDDIDWNTGEVWTASLRDGLASLTERQRRSWNAFLLHCRTATSSKPSKKWLENARGILEEVDNASFEKIVESVLKSIGKPRKSRFLGLGESPYATHPTQILDTHSDLLRGLIWCVPLGGGSGMAATIGDVAEVCFKKIPGVGPRSTKIGNACMTALSHFTDLDSLGQLSRLKAKARYPSMKKQLEKVLERAANRLGISVMDLEELGVPDFGFTRVGALHRKIGDYEARLEACSARKSALVWARPDGKIQKSVPAALKTDFKKEIAELRRLRSAVDKMVTAQRSRLEQLYLQDRSWGFADFRKRYLDHPLVGLLARRLIWQFGQGDGQTAGIWLEDRLVGANGQALEGIDAATRVCLWHPISSSVHEVVRWRRFIERHQIVQPFKQAHREVYFLTDAERDTANYSNRFAAHILRQHQLSALCRERGWRYGLQGMWDSANIPFLDVTAHRMRVEYWLEPAGGGQEETTEMAVFLYLATDQVRFYSLHEDGPMALEDVPPLVLSEVMRDVDLFVAVCSVGNDPTWADGGPGAAAGHADYWYDFSFGELVESGRNRRQILESLLPRLKIADRCRLEDRFLVVRGEIRSYKIHLGSGNVLMTPNDQYLCVVPGRVRETENLYLPFEGDTRLAVILSKAFLLADDKRIKDGSIQSQIRS